MRCRFVFFRPVHECEFGCGGAAAAEEEEEEKQHAMSGSEGPLKRADFSHAENRNSVFKDSEDWSCEHKKNENL